MRGKTGLLILILLCFALSAQVWSADETQTGQAMPDAAVVHTDSKKNAKVATPAREGAVAKPAEPAARTSPEARQAPNNVPPKKKMQAAQERRTEKAWAYVGELWLEW